MVALVATALFWDRQSASVAGGSGEGEASGSTGFVYTQITDLPVSQSAFVGGITPDGRWLLISSACDLQTTVCGSQFQTFLYDTLNGTFERISPASPTQHTAGLDVSADGNLVVLQSQADLVPLGNADGTWEKFLWDRVTGFQQLTFSPDQQATGAAELGDDGTTLVFLGKGDYDPLMNNSEGIAEAFFYPVGASLSEIRQMTNAVAPGLFNISGGQISGDGQWFAFSTSSDDIPGWPNPESQEIVVMDLTTVPPSVVTATVTTICNQFIGTGPCQSRTPSLSEDGSRIAFSSGAGFPGTAGNGDGNFEIYLLERQLDDTWTYMQLTNTVGRGITNPSIDGSGQKVVFQSNQEQLTADNPDNNIEIFLWEDGATPPIRQVTNTLAIGSDIYINAEPQISGDGQTIAFQSKADLDPSVGNADGSTEVFIAQLPEPPATPTPTPTNPPTNTPVPPTNTPVPPTNTPVPPTNTPCPDFDGDTLCDAVDPDDDNDGCTDVAEQQTAPGSEITGGRRDYLNFWDFYDTPNAANVRDKQVDLFNDIFAVALRFGARGDPGGNPLTGPIPAAPTYHSAFDRSPPTDANGIISGPADGNIDLFNDIFGVAFQFGHNCTGLP